LREKKGHPPIFHTKLKDEILELDDTVGLNTFAQNNQEETLLFPVETPNVIKTFNTQEEFEKIKDDNRIS